MALWARAVGLGALVCGVLLFVGYATIGLYRDDWDTLVGPALAIAFVAILAAILAQVE